MLARLIGLMLFVSPILSSAEAAAQTPFDMTPVLATRPAAGAGGGAPAVLAPQPGPPSTPGPLACSVNQYSVCAARSGDPRVHQLKAELEETIKPQLRLVASR